MIRRVGIVARRGLADAAPTLRDLAAWLGGRGLDAVFEHETAATSGLSTTHHLASRDELPGRVDLVLVLGGDGTLLGMADRVGASGRDIPILGVNFGRLGYLTEITLPELYDALEAAIEGRAALRRRSMLEARLSRGGLEVSQHLVLNDVVVTKGALSRVIDLTVSVDGQFVTRVTADGLIVSSPTGSTAYNLATGGPIVHPDVDAIVITPIAPHTLSNRPIVVPGRSIIEVRPDPGMRNDEIFATFDGQTGCRLEVADVIAVTRADRVLHMVSSATRTYYATLREKLGWGET